MVSPEKIIKILWFPCLLIVLSVLFSSLSSLDEHIEYTEDQKIISTKNIYLFENKTFDELSIAIKDLHIPQPALFSQFQNDIKEKIRHSALIVLWLFLLESFLTWSIDLYYWEKKIPPLLHSSILSLRHIIYGYTCLQYIYITYLFSW